MSVDGQAAGDFSTECRLVPVGGSFWSSTGIVHEWRCNEVPTPSPGGVARAVSIATGPHRIVFARAIALDLGLGIPSTLEEKAFETSVDFVAEVGRKYYAITTWSDGRYWCYLIDDPCGAVVAGDAPPGWSSPCKPTH